MPRITPANVSADVKVVDVDRSGPDHSVSSALARPKSSTFTASVAADLDVGWFEIAMDDAGGVGGVEGIGNLLSDSQRLWERDCTTAYPSVQAVALDELEHEGWCGAAQFKTVDRTDVRVIERGEESRLAFEACHAIGVNCAHRRQDLQGDVAIERRVASAIDLAHPSALRGPRGSRRVRGACRRQGPSMVRRSL